MLATTQPEDIPQTIRSRCQHFSFRAVKFDAIVAQLRDLVTREKIEADDDALALLAEAGDGSMRDALSILDQAIASASGKITADSVRNLVGAAPAHILEQVMQAVSESRSEEVLRQVDHLIGEGHSPTHFARQLVRFLRNATVAKIAGKDSPLLQVSSEERERVARVADWFGEEDLTRHLQIMLRTHSELGYKQEQRFHLELGLLKMAHAQKLLPIEQLLSDVAAVSNRHPAKASSKTGHRGQLLELRNAPARTNFSSTPKFRFSLRRRLRPQRHAKARSSVRLAAKRPAHSIDSERHRARNHRLRESRSSEPASRGRIADRRDVASNVSPEALKLSAPEPQPQPELQSQPKQASTMVSVAPSQMEHLQNAVLQALTDGNQRILVSMLSAGDWSIQGNELVIKIEESQTVVDMSLSSDARRLAIASASGVLGRAVKLKVISGATVPPQENKRNGASHAAGPGGRGRAEQDPVVRRMQEKFGAQVRTVIDYREKR